MYKYYIVPDATKLSSHAAIYENLQLLWDPLTESDAYAITEPSNKSELNKSASLEFSVLPANIHYNDFHKNRTVVVVYDDDDWIFEGVVTDAPLDFFKQRKVTCADPLTYLCQSVQAPDEKNEISTPTSGSNPRYFPVPDAWYTGANPKGLDWYEQTINAIYVQVAETDVYVSGTTYYVKSGDVYSVWSGNAGTWAARPTLYVASGHEPKYTKSNDISAVADKRYYYLVTNQSGNYSGTTTTVAAATEETIVGHIERLLNVHNSQVDKFKCIFPGNMYSTSDTSKKEFKAANYRTTWDALKSDILDEYGKYFRIRLGDDHALYLDYLELYQLPTVPDSMAPLIEFTNNMMNMSESDDNDDDIFTVLVPIGKDNLTVKDVTGHDSPAHNDSTHEVDPYVASWGGNKRYVVVSRKAIARYGYIIKPQQFSDVEDASTLWDRTVKYIQNNYDYHTEYEVKAIDIRFINGSGKRIVVGDKVRLHSQWHGVDTTELYVISAEHDQMNPENDSYRIGIPTSDREANNRTLTGQSNSAKSKQAKNSASTSSGMSRMSSILEEYIHVTEWGLEMSSRLKNEYESNDRKYMTRFIQDEEHLNLAAQKLFGVDGDGVGDLDAGYGKVLKSEYRKSTDGPYKNPSEEHWFEYKNGQYVLSTDTTADPDKQYYYQRLWTRYSNIDVGPGGIKAVVDGNHERSTYCSSWIQSNEEQILAITGHIHVDENGQVIIDSGAGARTGHTSERTEIHYVPVQKTLYGNSPAAKRWYERVIVNGRWPGADVDESVIMQGAQPNVLGPNESTYYKISTDAVAKYDKAYYVRQTSVEEFTAEYGIYDENTLNGGIISRMVNNPQYFPVPAADVQKAGFAGETAYQHGWWIYDKNTGEFGEALAGEKVNPYAQNTYFTRTNTSQQYTDIWGEHVVIGRTMNYAGMDAATQAKVQKYIADHRLDGTITEIASDVVVVNALIAKYIETDEIIVNTMLSAEHGYFGTLFVGMNAERSDIQDGEIVAIYGSFDHTDGGNIIAQSLTFSPLGSSSGFGYGEVDGVPRLGNPNDIVMGFGNPTYSGDDVKIPFTTLYDFCQSYTDETHVITFTKPASLGTVTWSSGDKTLTAKTVGGKDFLVGEIKPFAPSGQSEAMAMQNAGYLATETTGYNQVYGLYYTRKDASNNDVSAKTMLFKTPKNRYPDAVSTIRTYSDDSVTDDGTIALEYSDSTKVYAQYYTESEYDKAAGETKTYTSKNGVTVTSPGVGEVKTYYERLNSDSEWEGNSLTAASSITLDYSESVKIKGRHQDGLNNWHEAPVLTVMSKADRYSTGKTDGANTLSIDPSSDKTLGYSESVTVKATTTKGDGRSVEKSVKITAPANNATSHSVSLTADKTHSYTEKGSSYTQVFSDVTFENQKWYRFSVTCGDDTNYYAIYVKTS